MRGHVRKRGGGWSVVIDIGRDERGCRRQKWHSGYATKREAERALTALLGELQQATYVEPSRLTLESYVRGWLEAVAPRLRPSTASSYRQLLECYVIPRLGSRPLQTLEARHLNALYGELLKRGAVHSKGPLSPRTVRYTHTVLRSALKDAVRQNVLQRNVADLATPPRAAEYGVGIRVWSADELRRFLEEVAGDRLYAAWFLAATTGMRRGEVLGLRWGDLDLDLGRCSIVQTLVTVDYELSFSTPKTARGRRLVALDEFTVRALRVHRNQQECERRAWAELYHDGGLVFAREDGSPVHPDRFSDLFDQFVHRAKLPRIRLHDLRHTHATLALQAGINPKVVSERLGHSSVAITLDTYSHVMPSLQDEAASVVTALIFGSRRGAGKPHASGRLNLHER